MVKELTKSLSNTSTTSIDSGVFDVDILQSSLNNSEEDNTATEMNIGEAVTRILVDARKGNRLILGVKNAINYLNDTENPEHSLFFFMAPARDHTTHMSTILLKAFCFENDIYIVQLDSEEKLSRIINADGASCALVQRSDVNNDVYNKYETILIDHCEDFWGEIVQPIIKLPDK